MRVEDKWIIDAKMRHSENIKAHLYPTILGGIIGDALGVPVEFKERDTYSINDMIGGGTHNQLPGTWSDDTSLTLCLMESLIESTNVEILMRKFVDYFNHGYMTPYGVMFDIGHTTYNSIREYINGTPAEQCGQSGKFDNGNGSIMRISPLVFLFINDFDFNSRVKKIEKYSSITHAHPRSILGCIIYIEILLRLYLNDSFEKAIETTKELCIENLCKTKYRNEIEHYKRILNLEIGKLSKQQIFSDGYIVHTLEAALWCLIKSNNFCDAVLSAVNLGKDTDTVGFLTGTMAGMFYKIDSIPKEWIKILPKLEFINDLCSKFVDYCTEVTFGNSKVMK